MVCFCFPRSSRICEANNFDIFLSFIQLAVVCTPTQLERYWHVTRLNFFVDYNFLIKNVAACKNSSACGSTLPLNTNWPTRYKKQRLLNSTSWNPNLKDQKFETQWETSINYARKYQIRIFKTTLQRG